MITAQEGRSSLGFGLLALAVWCCSSAAGTAQFRIESQVVRVDVSVDDQDGPILNLDHDDFELYEAGTRVPFRLLEPASVPVTVLFAVDVSASTIGERQRQLGKGAALFAGGLSDADSCAVIAFAREPSWVREFTPCGPAVGEDVQAMSAGGMTTVRDSLLLSLALLHRQKGRGVLLLFTDAYDNLSWTWDGLVMEAVRRSGALVYSIVARPRRAVRLIGPTDAGYRLVREVSEVSGGRLLEVNDDSDLSGAYEEVLEELRTRYVLSFTPNPKFHGFVPIEVRVKPRGVEVRARPGYVARR